MKMHAESYELMKGMLAKLRSKRGLRVLDVGSLDINGSFRPLTEAYGWSYIGLDVRAGKNVDVVTKDAYHYPFLDDSFDVVLSGSTMEHVEAIWLWVPEVVRVLKPGGLLAIHTHWQYPEHRYPVDCWRILPDGMRFLLDQTGVMERYEIQMANEWDLATTAWKRAG